MSNVPKIMRWHSITVIAIAAIAIIFGLLAVWSGDPRLGGTAIIAASVAVVGLILIPIVDTLGGN